MLECKMHIGQFDLRFVLPDVNIEMAYNLEKSEESKQINLTKVNRKISFFLAPYKDKTLYLGKLI